jgi:hypothetical protein
LGDGHFGINQYLESSEPAAVQAEAHGAHSALRCIIGNRSVVAVSKARKVALVDRGIGQKHSPASGPIVFPIPNVMRDI